MDLMTLAAKITLDDSGFNKGVNQAESTGKKLAGKMSAMTVAVGNIAADMIKKGASAIKSIVDGAVDGYANYEQLIGGVETLFKDSAGKVEKYANKSFKTTGLSANAYMETVTGFSASLLQGLQGDTEKAADIANMAVTDMADNANKMGTDIGSIQNAYQGFAKQNYTMLDNLKLGYGGTREEMIRLINDSGILGEEIKSLDGITFDQIIEAIHKIQTELGITGTTAKEAADTISGSKASLKAAWEDMLAAAGGKDDKAFYSTLDNFKQSFSTYMENFVPSLILSIKSGGGIAKAIADAITDLPTQLLSDLGSAVITSGTDAVTGVSKITSWLISSITEMFKSASANKEEIANFGKAIGDFLGTAISDIVANAPDIINGIIDVGVNLAGGLVEGLFKGLFGQDAEVDKVLDQLNETIDDAELKATQGGALIAYLQSLQEMYGSAVTETEEWKQAIEELKGVMPESEGIFEKFAGDINGALAALQSMNEELRKTAVNSALMKALEDEYYLLTQQTVEYNKQKARYDRNEYKINYAEDKIRQGIIDSAGRQARAYWDNTHDEQGNVTDFFDEQRYNDLVSLADGMARFGDEFMALEDVDFEGLAGLIGDLMDEDLAKSVEDERETINQAKEEMRQAQEAMKEQAQEIEATKQGIEDTKSAVLEASKQLNESFGTTASGIDTNGASVAAALASVAAQIASIHFSGGSGGESGGGLFGRATGFINTLRSMFTGHATGMDYVPYNGYRAELHRGEAVLTKREAENYRRARGSADIYQAVDNAVESAMSKVFVMMNGEKVGDLTTKRVRKNINASSYNKLRAMGG